MNPSPITELIRKGESQQVEFKLETATPEVVAHVVCSFLNTQGGTLLIGVSDEGHVAGVRRAQERAREIEKTLSDLISPSALWSVTTEPFEGENLIVVAVPPGPSRPYVCQDVIYVRRGSRIERTQTAAPGDIHKIISERAGEPTRWERLPTPGLNLEELDRGQIEETVDNARVYRFRTFRDPLDVVSVLSELGLMEFGLPTNASQVLFAKKPASRLPQTRIRATAYSTDKGGGFLDNQIYEGHLFEMANSVETFLGRNVTVASSFDNPALARGDIPSYPYAALREGLINALAHRDYSSYAGGVSVGVYPNRVEIWNSGSLPEGWKPGDLKKNHPSLPPNPDIAHVLYLRRLIERVGRGTIKIVDECRAAGLREPKWTQDASGVTLTIYGNPQGGQSIHGVSIALNDRQRQLLDGMETGQNITLHQYHERVSEIAARRTARRDLDRLVAGGWLCRMGPNRKQTFLRTEKPKP